MELTLDALVLGETLRLAVDTVPATDLSSVPVALVLDHESGERLTLRHLGGAADAAWVDAALVFAKPPAWTATQMLEGYWNVRLLVGTQDASQSHAGLARLRVILPQGGVLPTDIAPVVPPAPTPPAETSVPDGTVFRIRRLTSATLVSNTSPPPPPPIVYPLALTGADAGMLVAVNGAGTGLTTVPPGGGSAVTVAGIAGPVIGAAELTDAQYAALADGDTLFAAAVIADPAGVTLAFESAGVVRAVTFAALLAALGAVVSPFALLTAGGDTLVTAGGDTITYGA